MNDQIIHISRDALARALYLQQARRHAHPDDPFTPAERWDSNTFRFKFLWLAEADRLIAELEETGAGEANR